ncbi:MAG: hypothetical protein MJ151_03645 [Lachnospiraceae bacterium]|nr:hypothetical protein [Lachnospiraceae bacterium]
MDKLKKISAILILLIIGLLVISLIVCTILRLTKYIMPIILSITLISILVYVFVWFAKRHSK